MGCLLLRVEKSIHTEEHQRLAALLRTARLDRGLTQEDVAVRLHEPQSFVSKYENGERRLDLVELHQICESLGVLTSTIVARWLKG